MLSLLFQVPSQAWALAEPSDGRVGDPGAGATAAGPRGRRRVMVLLGHLLETDREDREPQGAEAGPSMWR